jgi:hypothetical protein
MIGLVGQVGQQHIFYTQTDFTEGRVDALDNVICENGISHILQRPNRSFWDNMKTGDARTLIN